RSCRPTRCLSRPSFHPASPRNSPRAAGTWASGRDRRGGRARGPSAARWSSCLLRWRPMASDAYGLPVSTTAPEALALYDRAVRALQAWQAGAPPVFPGSADRDPRPALAHAGAAVCLFLEERCAETKAATEAARTAVAGQTERERSHVAALTAWTSWQVPQAERLMREHLVTFPRDAMV